MRDEWMPLEILEHVYVGLVLEHLCKSFDCSCMAEGLFDDNYILLWIASKMRVILCCIVVSHRLNTKEALPKFSRKLTLNHIGESLGSRGGKLRKPKMKTLFWCHRNDAPNPCSFGCPFQSQNLGICSLNLIRTRGKLSHDSGMAWITTSGGREQKLCPC